MTNGNQALVQDQGASDVVANVPVGDPGPGSSTLPLRQSTEIQGDILAPFNADGHTCWNIRAADGQTGWSTGEFLKALGIAIDGTAVVTANDVNVRAAAGLNAAIMAKLKTGDHVTVVGGPQTADGHTWWNVLMQDGHSGWSAADFLRAA